jgi:hypothetical protein
MNAVAFGEEPPGYRTICWYTALGYKAWGEGGMYDGPPCELHDGEVEFVCVSQGQGTDYATWHYVGDTSQGRTAWVLTALPEYRQQLTGIVAQ